MYDLEEIIGDVMKKEDFKIEKIPEIDLYMDQVLGLFEEYFPYNEDESKLTKTMINNYTKSKLINPPIKKKYNKENILLIAIICQLKRSISLSEIKSLMNEYNEVEDVYSTFLEKKEEMNKKIKEEMYDLVKAHNNSGEKNELLDALLFCYYSNLMSEMARDIIRNIDK